jgi:hypothetical protein
LHFLLLIFYCLEEIHMKSLRNAAVVVSLFAATLVFVSGASAGLVEYDAAVSGEAAKLTTPIVFNGGNSSAFNFGALSSDATIEFIVEGDPNVGAGAKYLAFGSSDGSNNLRYEQWMNSLQLGFTRGGVADYVFTPGVPSPTTQTLIAYVWDDGADTMDLYLNGALAGSTSGVDSLFQMPTGAGFLGNDGGLNAGMVGTIYRVTTYDSALDPSTLAAHGAAFLPAPVPEPTTLLLVLGGCLGLGLNRRGRRHGVRC